MIDSLEFLDEYGLGILDVAERDGALLEIALVHLGVNQSVDEFANSLLGIFRHRS